VNDTLIDDIVKNVLAKLQSASSRPVNGSTAQPVTIPTQSLQKPISSPVPVRTATVASTPVESKPTAVDLISPVITADVLENAVRPGQALRIGRSSILTPSARDWLNAKRISWTRQDKSAASGSTASGSTSKFRWQLVLQTVTPSVQALHEGLRRLADGWKIELVGQPMEAAALATSLINTADCDGVVVFSEYAEFIACKANRNERVRAAVMHNSKQWELVTRTLGANVVCISPVGRTFVELRNLLRECAASKPNKPAGF
jgi:hypothetical protein